MFNAFPAALQTVGLTHIYSQKTPFEKTAIKNVNFTARSGEIIGLIGHTGSGKSTLIQHFNGLLAPTEGKVLINGEDIHSSKDMLRAAKFAVGLVFQYPEYQLFEETIYADIAFGPKNMGLGKDEIDRRVLEAADIVGLSRDYLTKSPFDVSGGQKRRAALAGVFAMEPEILVLDEPMAGLDPVGREDVFRYIKSYHDKHNTTIIFVTHSMEEAAKMATRIVVMSHAEILDEGTPRQVFSHYDLLKQAGLDIPSVTRVVNNLKEKGVEIDTSVYTVSQAAQALKKLKEGRHA